MCQTFDVTENLEIFWELNRAWAHKNVSRGSPTNQGRDIFFIMAVFRFEIFGGKIPVAFSLLFDKIYSTIN
jgi:hypothetical protein